ncbi:hypothetical protein PIB30_079080 [Stylosanthes scabra]|uniref:Uncharacterized protein n=1 Tax=Stylosanthes scabra TaxID=79078 RepID=A0ABU6UQG8_9FABA|nr:hypothetical protein [Stylosanthes scabra]
MGSGCYVQSGGIQMIKCCLLRTPWLRLKQDSWTWFLQNFIDDMRLEKIMTCTFMTDQQKRMDPQSDPIRSANVRIGSNSDPEAKNADIISHQIR